MLCSQDHTHHSLREQGVHKTRFGDQNALNDSVKTENHSLHDNKCTGACLRIKSALNCAAQTKKAAPAASRENAV